MTQAESQALIESLQQILAIKDQMLKESAAELLEMEEELKAAKTVTDHAWNAAIFFACEVMSKDVSASANRLRVKALLRHPKT